jgi:hypothetical protein
MPKAKKPSGKTPGKDAPPSPPAPVSPGHEDTDHAALVVLRPLMDALAEEDLLPVRVNISAAAVATLARVLDLGKTALSARLAALPATEYDAGCVQRVEQASRACLELTTQIRTSQTMPNEARVDASVIAEGTQRKTRMLRVLKHYFEEHPIHSLEIADIRLGSGYADLASDLKRLAVLYKNPEVLALVSKDPAFYDPKDAPRARALAQSINEQIEAARSSEEQRLSRDLARAWTVLGSAWDQLRRGVTFLAWNDPATLALYPPLFSLGRSAPGSRTQTPTEDTTDPTPPG